MKKITVKNGQGREVNPNPIPNHLAHTHLSYWDFEQSVKEYPAPGIPDTKEGETLDAELVYQRPSDLNYTIFENCSEETYRQLEQYNQNAVIPDAYPIRQIYVLSPTKEEPRGEVKTEPMFFDSMDDRWKEIHQAIHNQVSTKGWKDFYYAVLRYQDEEIVSGYKLIDGVSDDYKRLFKKTADLTTIISAREGRIKELEDALRKIINGKYDAYDAESAINEVDKIAKTALKK